MIRLRQLICSDSQIVVRRHGRLLFLRTGKHGIFVAGESMSVKLERLAHEFSDAGRC